MFKDCLKKMREQGYVIEERTRNIVSYQTIDTSSINDIETFEFCNYNLKDDLKYNFDVVEVEFVVSNEEKGEYLDPMDVTELNEFILSFK